MIARKSAAPSRILGPTIAVLGLFLLSPAIFVGVWLARQGAIGFDPVTRNIGIGISIIGLIFVVLGVTLTIGSRKGVAWKETRRVLVTDGAEERRVVIITRSDGLYRYEQERFFHPASEDEGIEFGWQRSGGSGLFQTATDAERDARQTVPWVRDQVECLWEAIDGFASPGDSQNGSPSGSMTAWPNSWSAPKMSGPSPLCGRAIYSTLTQRWFGAWTNPTGRSTALSLGLIVIGRPDDRDLLPTCWKHFRGKCDCLCRYVR